jgi:hypothetical protein
MVWATVTVRIEQRAWLAVPTWAVLSDADGWIAADCAPRYVAAMPGKLIQALKTVKKLNPVGRYLSTLRSQYPRPAAALGRQVSASDER